MGDNSGLEAWNRGWFSIGKADHGWEAAVSLHAMEETF